MEEIDPEAIALVDYEAAHPNLTGNPRNGVRYRAYTDEDMNAAIRAVLEDGISLRQASIKYCVPKTTLAERMGDRRPRPPPPKPVDYSNTSNRGITRYTWDEADLVPALEAVQNGTMSLSMAAKRFGVPASAVNARLRGREPRTLKGEASRLTMKQEGLLADWVRAQNALGCPPNKDEVFNLAERVLQKQGADKRLGKQWIGHWMRRHPGLEILDWKKPVRPEKPERTNPPNNAAEPDVSTFSQGTFAVVDAADVPA